MNAHRPITLAVVGLLCLLGAQSATAQLSSQDEAAIHSIHDSALAALVSGDVAAYAGHFSEDVILQPPNAPSVRGRAALEAWARGLPTGGSLSWPNLQVHGDGSIAYGTADYIRQIDGEEARGKQMGVFRRDPSGKWWIVAVSFSPDLPEAAITNGRNEAAADVFYSVWNTREYGRLDTVLAPEFRRQGSDAGTEGLTAWKAYMREIHTTFPDFHIEVHERRYDGEIGVTHWTATGTNSTTGARVTVPGMSLLRFRNGVLTEQMAYFDPALLEGR